VLPATPAARWRGPPPVDPARVTALRGFSRLPEPLCELLVRRGFEAGPGVARYLRPTLDALHDPARLPDLPEAADRIEATLAAGDRIFVHGDYDVDGMSGAAVLAGALRDLGGDVVPFVPHRTRDGYDLGAGGLEAAAAAGASLIVTADCGVTAVDAVAEARRRSIDVVVTDHHRPGPTLPAATAVVNPSLPGHDYPFDGLAGVGVAFKLVQELFVRKRIPGSHLNRYLDLVALGTIADQAPLIDENRALARFGLRVLQRTRRPGLRALMRNAGVGRWSDVRASDVAFRLAPRLNSAGRIGEASDGLRLLMGEDPEEAERLAEKIEEVNARRREADREILDQARAGLASAYDPETDRIVVLWGEGWHPGVLGIAASRLVDDLRRPVILVAVEGDRGRGSARSIPEFHLFDALSACGGLFERFGGHGVAAGFDIRADRLEALRDALREVAAERLPAEALAPELRLDLELSLEDLSPELVRGFAHLEPFGTGNEMPTLAVRDVRFSAIETVGADGAHLRARLEGGGGGIDAIGFGMGDRAAELAGAVHDVAFELHVEATSRGPRVQAHVIAIADPPEGPRR